MYAECTKKFQRPISVQTHKLVLAEVRIFLHFSPAVFDYSDIRLPIICVLRKKTYQSILGQIKVNKSQIVEF